MGIIHTRAFAIADKVAIKAEKKEEKKTFVNFEKKTNNKKQLNAFVGFITFVNVLSMR